VSLGALVEQKFARAQHDAFRRATELQDLGDIEFFNYWRLLELAPRVGWIFNRILVGVEDSEGAARAILAKLAPSPSRTAPLPSPKPAGEPEHGADAEEATAVTQRKTRPGERTLLLMPFAAICPGGR
jgi:hypothetical protein